ncbi:hypothetical protein [Methanobrevibacter sp.]|uniref:DUF7657 domain-containing protein n=1 Tax=Methanobrevibacter sp. TaxID=66852 RepID=UPI00388E90BF
MIDFSKRELTLSAIFALIFSALLGIYVSIVENSYLFYELDGMDYLNVLASVISIKQIIVFFAILFVIFLILSNVKSRSSVLEFIYRNRILLSVLLFIACVILEIHGSSIGVITFGAEPHRSLLGTVRWTKTDEYAINTMFAFSQYHNGFGYISNIIRAFPTDVFVIGELPILDPAVIFKPFQWGYLFLSQAKGLAFCWMGRLIALFVISFEFGLLLTRKNRILALAYAVLLTFSPLVQWWFGVNGLIEMFVFGQLSILILDWYMNILSYSKRFLCIIGLVFSLGAFTLSLYPAWEVALGYVFLAIAVWIIHKNWNDFEKSKIDILYTLIFAALFGLSMFYVLTKSSEAIAILSNTVYPGLRLSTGGADFYWLSGDPYIYFDYMRNVFEPLKPTQIISRVSMSYCISFFPLGLILFGLVQFVQKKRDALLYLLIIAYVILLSFYLFTFPETYARLTLLGKTQPSRLFAIITFIDLLILIRAMSISDRIDFSKVTDKLPLIISFILVGAMLVLASTHLGERFYSLPIMLIALVIFTASFYFILKSPDNRKAQIGFLCCVLIISVPAGAMVNPVEMGTDYFFDNPALTEIASIVESNPDAIWVVDGDVLQISAPTSVGARTLNSVNPYPNFDMWSKLDPNGQSRDIYNRYALVQIELVNNTPTTFDCGDDQYSINKSDQVNMALNINDLEKLNVTYVISSKNLEQFSNDNMSFIKTYEFNALKIYEIRYK